MEQYINITELAPRLKLKINEVEYITDENGGLFKTVSQLCMGKIGLNEYESALAVILSDEQQTKVYTSWGTSSGIMLSSTANALNGDKQLAKQILKMGEEYGVLTRGTNCQWRVIDKIMKGRFVMLSNHIMERINSEPKIGATEAREKAMKEVNAVRNENKKQMINKKK